MLRSELVIHHAPRRLVRAAERAARDEIRHARAMRNLARRYGASVPEVRVRSVSPRGLEAIAIDNAVEGCVRETLGSVVATWQAHMAEEPAVRLVMRRIAEDETDHAAFSWALARWIEGRLSTDARTRVRRARQAAIEDLRSKLMPRRPQELVATLGLPPASTERALLEELMNQWCQLDGDDRVAA
jgi:hypothetical protein